MLAELYVLSGRDAGKLIEAVGPTIFFGRAATNHYRVRDPQASRVHCRIDVSPDGLRLQDTNSGNGTFLNEDLVTDPCMLADGDEIRIGTTRLKVLIETDQDKDWVRGRREDSAIVPTTAREGSGVGAAVEEGSGQHAVVDPKEASESAADSVIPDVEADAPAPPKPTDGKATARRKRLRDVLPGFTLDKKLGSGNTPGTAVYRATQLSLDRAVTLKVFLPRGEVRQEHADRFLREAKAIARLPHPNIVTIHDILARGKMRVIVSEYLQGGSLAQRLEDEQPMDTQEVFEVGEAIASALGYLHSRGVIHRQVNLDHVLYAPELDTFKLAGFGFVTGPEEEQQRMGNTSFIESPLDGFAYLAPEQLGSDLSCLTPATDVYSLGAILYACISGRAPFQGDRPVALAACVLRDPPPPLPESAPEELRRLVERCLEKQPVDRYADANVFLGELRACRATITP